MDPKILCYGPKDALKVVTESQNLLFLHPYLNKELLSTRRNLQTKFQTLTVTFNKKRVQIEFIFEMGTQQMEQGAKGPQILQLGCGQRWKLKEMSCRKYGKSEDSSVWYKQLFQVHAILINMLWDFIPPLW